MFFDRGPKGDPSRRLYIPNVDNGLELSDTVNGATGIKARQVQTRFLHYCSEGDGLVVSKKIPLEYLEYVKDLYGFRDLPHIFVAPNRNINNPNVPFALLHDILGNERLLRQFREIGTQNKWEITPFISHRWAHWLGKRVGLPVHGVPLEQVKSGHVTHFNDKVNFMRDCLGMHIPVPPGVIAHGWGDILSKAAEKMEEYGDIILRVGRSGGGFGLCIIRREDLIRSQMTVQQYIRDTIPKSSRASWNEQEVLVEHYLPKKCSPSTLVYIGESEIIRVVDTNQILDDQDHFLGARIPSGIDSMKLEILWLYTESSARHVQQNGGRGFYGIDWGILHDDSVVAFEPNYRFTGNWHIMCIRRKLNVGDYAVSMHKDKMLVSRRVTFQKLKKAFKDKNLLWDEKRGDGVVITIPPDGEIFGFVAIAPSKRRAQQLFDEVEQYAKDSFKK